MYRTWSAHNYPSHLSICIIDSLWRSEEIAKVLNCTFQCDHYHCYYESVSRFQICTFQHSLLPVVLVTQSTCQPGLYKNYQYWTGQKQIIMMQTVLQITTADLPWQVKLQQTDPGSTHCLLLSVETAATGCSQVSHHRPVCSPHWSTSSKALSR